MQYPSPYGRYTLLESIGQGGMSAIDLAQQSVTDAQYLRFVVIKRMQAQFTEQQSFVLMFKDEARINAELQHNKIAQVYEFGQQEDEYYIAMEYIPGVDLRILQRELAKQAKGLPIRITLRILHDVCEALEYAHTRLDTYGRPMNVVHRDVNPRNIMISIRGEVKLIDFGVAKADNRLDKTVGHTLKGKFAYMSPEQIEGGKVDGRADLFALGLTLHELVDGRRPFAGLNEVQIMHRVLSGNIPALMGPKDHPQPELVQAIHECSLATNSEDRYPSAGHMQEAFAHAARACGGLANDAEMAAFFREIMPEEVKSIAHRLDRYRKEITQPHGFDPYGSSISQEVPTEFFDKPNKSIPPPPSKSSDLETAVITPPQDETLVNSVDPSPKPPTRLIIIITISILMLFGGGITVLNAQNQSPAPPPNQRQTVITSEEKTPIAPPAVETVKPEQVVPTPSQNQAIPEIEEPKIVPIPPVEQQAAPPQTTATEQQDPPEQTTPPVEQQTTPEQPVQTTPPTPSETVAEPSETVAEPSEATPEAELTYIFITSKAGQTNILVKMDGGSIGTLNGPLRTKVPVGEHTFLFINPMNGREFRQTIVISKSSQNLISVPEL